MRRKVHADNGRSRPGIVLLITLVILVILSTLAYSLSAKVASRRHRNNYLVDYTQAQYACSSAMKYALSSLNNLDANLVSRPNDPDFSDVFAMSDADYEAMLARFAQDAKKQKLSGTRRGNAWTAGASDSNDVNDAGEAFGASDSNQTGPAVPGPYGPDWPLMMNACEMEIASAQVKIEIEDENAKYPLGWAMITDEKLQAQANVSFATFCEWMKYDKGEITDLRDSLGEVNKIRPFKMTFTPLSVAMPAPVSVRTRAPATGAAGSRAATGTASPSVTVSPSTPAAAGAAQARGTTAPSGSNPSGAAQRAAPRKTVSAAEQAAQQCSDMARLLQGGLVDTTLLSRQTVVSTTRTETALKYLSLWGGRQVNVNSAPRHVLEAALCFGSVADAPKMATAIITQRKTKPFENMDEVKKVLSRYSESVEKCRDFLTTTSTVFTIRVTAVSGVAKVVAVAGVTREGRQVKRIAVMSD